MSNDWIPKQLREVANRVARGERPETTVRQLLLWFGYKGRHKWAVGTVRQALKKLNLVTRPDFDWTYLDGPITFLDYNKASSNESPTRQAQVGDRDTPDDASGPTSEIRPNVASVETEVSHGADAVVSVGDTSQMGDAAAVRLHADPMHRIARLKSAHTEPVSIHPDAEIKKAITVMMQQDFSQLPVMTGERTVRGMVSWRSLGKRFSLGHPCEQVHEAIERAQIVDMNASLFEAIQLIARHDCVLVRDSGNRICGIMTAYDVSVTFGELAEPFLLLGEIENHIRQLLEDRFTQAELEEARDPLDKGRPICDVTDLNFGGYVRLLQKPGRWSKLQLNLDKDTFVNELDKVREIRNDVMHFDPDGIDHRALQRLRDFANLLRQIQQLRAV